MNADLLQSFFSTLDGAALGYEIAWPNVPFDPPNTGVWLEVSHFPNRGLDESLSDTDVIRQGIFQVSAMGYQNTGLFDVENAAAQVAAVFPKLTPIGNTKVSRQPYTVSAIAVSNGRIELPLTIEYSG